MREEVRDLGRIRHMVESINNIFSFMENKTVQDLKKDKMLFYAVVKNIEIIGEAAYKLTFGFVDSHPQTPWKQIIRMRHVLVHGYFQIEPQQLYNVYTEDLPMLLPQLESYLKESNEDSD